MVTTLAFPLSVFTFVAASADNQPVITSVTNAVAQNPRDTGVGGTLVINGSGFGNTPPRITEIPDFESSAQVGDSALGVWANTSNLHIIDEGTFATDDIGFYHPDADINSCYLTIGKWTDTQIIVMLDDADLTGACSAIDDDDDMTVKVWSTNPGGGYGGPDAIKRVPDVVPLGDRVTINGVSPASGPVSGGTFNADGTPNPNGLARVSGERLDQVSVLWFGDGGYSGGIAVPKCEGGQDVIADRCFLEDGGKLTVVPPPASSNEDKGVYLGGANEGGTSHLDCVTVFTCDGGVFYYQSLSSIGEINTDLSLEYPDSSIGFTGSKELGESSCPGSAPSGGNELSYSVSATASSGQVNLRALPMTSRNTGLDIVSSLYMPTVLTISEAVNIDITLEGSISGCAAIPLLGGEVEGLGGGLYMMIGGNLTGSYTFHVVINKGVIKMLTGYTPGGVRGAEILEESCVNDEDEPAPCLETTHEFTAAGTVYFSPLWVDISAELGPFTFAAGAGVSLAGRVQASTDPANTGFEICYGGTYLVKAELDADVASFEFTNSGAFWGPFHLAGNNLKICPLGEIEDTREATTVAVEAADPVYDAEGTAVKYTATVLPATAEGEVAFSQNGQPIADCDKVEVNDGKAECTVRYDGTGQFKVDVNYSGDRTHHDGKASLDKTIAKAEQLITFSLPDQGLVGGTQTLTATGGASGEDVTFSVPTTDAAICRIGHDDAGVPFISYTAVGTCRVVAKQAGVGGYKAAPNVTEAVEVAKADQTITFVAPTDAVTAGTTPLNVTGTATTPTYTVAPTSATVCAVEPGAVAGQATLVYLGIGDCVLTITAPEDARTNEATLTSTIPVGQAPTQTKVKVTPTKLVATVTSSKVIDLDGPAASPVTPAGIDGVVKFVVDGVDTYTAPTVNGVATVDLKLTGAQHEVEATFLEDEDPNYATSSDSTERSDPILTHKITSAIPRSDYGWYRSPVTITTTCTATTAPLASTCPAPGVLTKNGRYADIYRVLRAEDGGVATVTIRGIKIDTVAPKIVYSVRKNSKSKVRVSITDNLSGILTKKTTSKRVTTAKGNTVIVYRTEATDLAGNRTVKKFRYKVPASGARA